MKRKIFISVLFILGGTIAAKAMGQVPEVTTATSPVTVSDIRVKEIKQITATGGYSFPVWSPDGTKIYAAGKYPDTGIVMMNPDGTNERTLSTQHYAGDGFKLSPDGSMIVYTASEMKKPVHFTLWVMNADGSNKKQLTTTNAAFPNWSPDSEKIIYVAGQEEAIYTIAPDGSNKTKIAEEKDCTRPIFSRNGSRIIFTTNYDIWGMDSNGSNKQRLTDFTTIGASPMWAKDDKRIYFDYGIKGTSDWGIWSMSTDGTDKRLIATVDCDDFSISEDGTKIVYDTLRFANLEAGQMEDISDIWIMNIDGADILQLTDTSDLMEVNPRWAPNGNAIVFSDYKKGKLYIINLEY